MVRGFEGSRDLDGGVEARGRRLRARDGRLAGKRRAAARNYDAFMSYSHQHDSVFAAALETAVERFAKPWYRMRALSVFRDDADLGANPSLWGSIEDALKSSSWFILLASADSARSPWVAREVSWWLRHRSAQRLLIAGTDQGLAWDVQRRDWAAAAPVPDVLRGVLPDEPRWVDLTSVHGARRWRQIPGSVVAAVAAPIRGVARDSLSNEHLRQHRLTMRLAGAAVVALTALTVLAVVAASVAVNQRDLAVAQRDSALSGQLAAQSEDSDTTNPAAAAMLAAAAWRIARTAGARESLREVLAQPERGVLTSQGLAAEGTEALAFSPDSAIVVTASSYEIKFWQAATNRQIGAPIKIGPLAIALSPDGKILAAACEDGTARLWNAVTHRPIGVPITIDANLSGGNLVAGAVAFSPAGKMFATGSAAGTVQLWDTASHRQVGHDMAVSGSVTAVAFSPDGKVLATAGRDVRLWNVSTQRQIGSVIAVPGGFVFASLAFSRDGRVLAFNGDGRVRLWDVDRHRPLGPALGRVRSVNAVAFRPGTSILATAGADGVARLWDIATHRQLGQLMPATSAGGMTAIAFSPGGKTLATASDDGSARLWDAAHYDQVGVPLHAGSGHGSPVMAFSSDGKTLISGDGTKLRLWKVSTQRQIGRAITVPGPITAVAYRPGGTMIAAAGPGGAVRLWDLTTRREYGRLMVGTGTRTAISEPSLAFSPNGAVLAATEPDGTVRAWSVTTQQPIAPQVNIGLFTADSAAFSPSGKLLALGGANESAQLADMTTRRSFGHPMSYGNGFEIVEAVSFDSTGNMLATAGEDGTARLWDVATQRQIGGPLEASSHGAVTGVAFKPGGHQLATVGSDSTLRIWDVATQRQIGSPIFVPDGAQSIASSPRAAIVATASPGGIIRLWNIAFPARLLQRACAIAGRSLTRSEWAFYLHSLPYQRTCP